MRPNLPKLSDRGRLRKQIGDLHFQILKLKRGERDELTGKPANGLGRFHILEVSTNPRLEFCDENVLLVNWLPHHFNYHHYGPASKRNEFTMKRIVELRGHDWREKLLAREKWAGRCDKLYLFALRESMRNELRSWENE